jgi:hypothetical protein
MKVPLGSVAVGEMINLQVLLSPAKAVAGSA